MFRHVRNHVRNFALFALAAVSLLGAGNAQGAFPERPITLIVPWAAGGGTVAVARQIAHMLERDLKQPVNVVNRTGGSGVVGHQAIASAAPDGYTFGLITLEINLMHWVGLTDLTFEKFTPLALVNQDPPRSTSRRTRLTRTSRSCSRISRRTRTRWWPRVRGRAEAGMSRSQA